MFRIASLTVLTTLAAANAHAAIPPMPGMTSGLGMPGNGMIHVEVAVQNNAVSAILRDGPSGGATPDQRLVAMTGGPYTTPYDVLNNIPFNAQYGWLEDQTIGFTPIDIAPDEHIAFELLSTAGPGTIGIYEGGNGMQLNSVGHAMSPIHGTDASPAAWVWDDDFLMQHNWYTFSAPGDYDLTFRVYVSDLDANPITTYTDTTVTLGFTVLPEPASAAFLLPLVLLGARRR
ncbi:hypothetical protein [Mucisphaera calidilacus]|uniref:PEP-CTERM sorting domain-containing protein n=1 Tax=Mucisphaera calidilacus TaxID=2527982 RepID=A0A518BYL0_9BACT|nr:hypothetical protein [Mucisphaera calidilacus]QDU72044.1 hypothetical protein Pan265_19040 [Mucisphaera calidilacus]